MCLRIVPVMSQDFRRVSTRTDSHLPAIWFSVRVQFLQLVFKLFTIQCGFPRVFDCVLGFLRLYDQQSNIAFQQTLYTVPASVVVVISRTVCVAGLKCPDSNIRVC